MFPLTNTHCCEWVKLAILEVLLHVLLEVALVGVGGLADRAQVAPRLSSYNKSTFLNKKKPNKIIPLNLTGELQEFVKEGIN